MPKVILILLLRDLEAILWELICHQTYKWHGLATDLSFYDSHGVVNVPSADVLPDGASPGSGALHFALGSFVQIKTNPGWKPLPWVRLECIVRLKPISSPPHTPIHA